MRAVYRVPAKWVKCERRLVFRPSDVKMKKKRAELNRPSHPVRTYIYIYITRDEKIDIPKHIHLPNTSLAVRWTGLREKPEISMFNQTANVADSESR